MRNYKEETERRVDFIKNLLKKSGANGIIYGNSGGKDCTLVSILCKKACDDTVGIVMPCGSTRNYSLDKSDAKELAAFYEIKTKDVDLGPIRSAIENAISITTEISDSARANIAPRLRMITLYAIAASEGRLVAGTGNRSEGYMGYFTKWGDGAYDFNPISDLTVTEVYEFLRYLNAPEFIFTKAPSAGLFEGQTDEKEMGVAYKAIDEYLFTGIANESDLKIIEEFHERSEHKRCMPTIYFNNTK